MHCNSRLRQLCLFTFYPSMKQAFLSQSPLDQTWYYLQREYNPVKQYSTFLPQKRIKRRETGMRGAFFTTL